MNAADAQLLLQMTRADCASRLLLRSTQALALCAAGALIYSSVGAHPYFARVLFALLLCGMGYLWCGAFLKNGTQQGRPSHACLVPGLRQRLMTLTAVLYIGCTLASAVVTALALGHAAYGLLGGGALAVYILFTHRYAWLNLLPTMLIVFSVALGNRPLRWLTELNTSLGEPALSAIGAVLLLALGWLALRAAFPHGGDRHFSWYRCHSDRQARLTGRQWADATSKPGAAWLRFAYHAALRRDSRGGAAPGRTMMHVLGRTAHDGSAMLYLLLSALFMALVARHLSHSGNHAVMLMFVSMMQACLMFSCLMYPEAVAMNAPRYGVEQGLYLLTPAAPPRADINRILFGTLLWRFLRLWLVSLAGVALIDWAALGEVRGISLVLAVLVLPCAGRMLRNLSPLPSHPGNSSAVATTSMVVFMCIIAIVLGWRQPDLPWLAIAGALALLVVGGLYLRWRRLLAMPPVLPAGRMA